MCKLVLAFGLLFLTACGPSDNAVAIAQAQAASEAARAAQITGAGLAGVSFMQSAILALLVLVVVLLLALLAYVVLIAPARQAHKPHPGQQPRAEPLPERLPAVRREERLPQNTDELLRIWLLSQILRQPPGQPGYRSGLHIPPPAANPTPDAAPDEAWPW